MLTPEKKRKIDIALQVIMVLGIFFVAFCFFMWANETNEHTKKLEELGCDTVCRYDKPPVDIIEINSP